MEVPTLCCNILSEAHTLIAGSTGSGKSVLLNSILFTACAYGNKHLLLIDPKRVELDMYKPVADGYACELDDSISLLDKTIDYMERRYKEMQSRKLKTYDGDDIYLCIDELADLMISPKRKDIITKIQKLTQLGRASKIHLIACTQVPNRRIIPSELQLNFTCKVGLHTDARIESRQIIGVNGCEELPMFGYGYLKRPSHPIELWEMPLYDDEVLTNMVEHTRRYYR